MLSENARMGFAAPFVGQTMLTYVGKSRPLETASSTSSASRPSRIMPP